MFRTLTTIAAVVALAIPAAAPASMFTHTMGQFDIVDGLKAPPKASPSSAKAPKPKAAGITGGYDVMQSLMTSFAVKPLQQSQQENVGMVKANGGRVGPPKPPGVLIQKHDHQTGGE
jgi:hypothetical protein